MGGRQIRPDEIHDWGFGDTELAKNRSWQGLVWGCACTCAYADKPVANTKEIGNTYHCIGHCTGHARKVPGVGESVAEYAGTVVSADSEVDLEHRVVLLDLVALMWGV